MAAQALQWQVECTKALEKAVAAGRKGREEWEAFRAQIPTGDPRIIIADADFSGKSLQGFDLSRCYITRCRFTAANLSSCNFSQCLFKQCNATDANIEGANFRDADMQGDGLVLNGCRIDGATQFEVPPEKQPDMLPKGLADLAAKARYERLWRNRKSYSPVVRTMLWLTQHGTSLNRLALLGLCVVAAFSLMFWISGDRLLPATLASMAYFLNLDAAHSSGWLALVGIIESLIGLIFFAVLTAILVSTLFESK